MFGKSLRLVDSAKNLGVVLDKKLYWKEHAEYATGSPEMVIRGRTVPRLIHGARQNS